MPIAYRKTPCCQWPGCVNFASRKTRRGEHVDDLYLCVAHAMQLRYMLPPEAARLHREATPLVFVKHASQGRVPPNVRNSKAVGA